MLITKQYNSFSFKFSIFYLQLQATYYIFTKTPKHKRLRLSAFVFGTWLLSFFGWGLASTLRSCYFWFRYVDDIIDGDMKYQGEIAQFRKDKKTLLQHLNSPELLASALLDDFDYLIIDCYQAARKLGYDNQKSMLTLFEALEYDIDRVASKKMYYSAAEIKEYFDKLDIPSVLMTFQFINEHAINIEDLYPLIDATRERYNVRDFVQDCQVGIVNVSIEDLQNYGIEMQAIQNAQSLKEACAYEPFKAWFKDKYCFIEQSLHSGKTILKDKPIRFRTKLALWSSFIRPCEANLREWKELLA